MAPVGPVGQIGMHAVRDPVLELSSLMVAVAVLEEVQIGEWRNFDRAWGGALEDAQDGTRNPRRNGDFRRL